MDTDIVKSVTSPATSVLPRPSRRRWLGLLAIPVALGALAFGATRAEAFGDGMMGPGFRKEHMDKMLTSAGATDAQKTQIQTIWQNLRPQLRPLHKQHADLRHQLGEAIAAPSIDQAKVEQLRKQSVQTMDQISALVTQGMVQSAQVLTPAQRQTVLQQMEQHRHHLGAGPDAGE
jgi:Spy/CpxP family protein refolding chaperone